MEERKRSLKDFPPPANYLMMDSPKLNLEVKAAVDSTIQRRDEKIIEKQEKISTSLTGISKTIEIVLKSNPPEKKQFLESINGVMRLLANLQQDETSFRGSLIPKNIAAPFRDILEDRHLILAFCERLIRAIESCESCATVFEGFEANYNNGIRK